MLGNVLAQINNLRSWLFGQGCAASDATSPEMRQLRVHLMLATSPFPLDRAWERLTEGCRAQIGFRDLRVYAVLASPWPRVPPPRCR